MRDGRTAVDRPALPDVCATAGVLGVAAAAWLAWSLAGGELPVVPVVVLMVVTVAAGMFGFVLRFRVGGGGVHAGNKAAYRTYNRSLLFEVVAIVAGVVVLGRLGVAEYIPAWTLAMMGLHFLPLAGLYRIPALRVVAGIVVVISVLGVLAGVTGWAMPATVACGLGGLALFVTAVWLIGSVLRRRAVSAPDAEVVAGR